MGLTARLLSAVLLGSIGMGYFIYGKKEAKLMPMLAGAGLCIFPYFVSDLFPTITLGICFLVLPFAVDI